ncbi:hypothetical protein HHI36_001091 [Cryptolaemus montrouzieri]|uniref:Uncharacterized protein n=1 Tax=Cryptolaemus montrouzieri TaxID=559131 RepID=A0ABD2P6T2_9CUCU
MARLGWGSANIALSRGEPLKSHIDVTLSSNTLLRKIRNWQIEHKNPFTDHGHISFDLEQRGQQDRKLILPKNFNTQKFRLLLEHASTEEIRGAYTKVLEALKEATSEEPHKTQPYWWTNEISQYRQQYVELRRKYTRDMTNNKGMIGQTSDQMKEARKKWKRRSTLQKRNVERTSPR